MKIVFTKSNNIFSKLIRFFLNEPVSHMAIVFDEKIVFQSNLLGVSIAWYETFKKKNDVVYEFDFNTVLEKEEELYQNVITVNDEKDYDFAAFFYFSWRAILYKFFKIPIPRFNKFNNINQYLCIEILKFFKKDIDSNELAMLSPFQVYLKLINKQL